MNHSQNRLLLPVSIRLGFQSIEQSTFIDSGADDVFIDSKFVQTHAIPLIALANPVSCRLADGQISSTISHRTTPLQMIIDQHEETISFYVIPSLCHPIILGLSWLRLHNPTIDWKAGTCSFVSESCLSACLPVQSISSIDASPSLSLPIPLSNRFSKLMRQNPDSLPVSQVSSKVDSDVDFASRKTFPRSLFPTSIGHEIDHGRVVSIRWGSVDSGAESEADSVMDAEPTEESNPSEQSWDDADSGLASDLDEDRVGNDDPMRESSLSSLATMVYPFQESVPSSNGSVPQEILDSHGQLFSDEAASSLPPHRPEDCTIDLFPDSVVPPGKIYQLTPKEHEALESFIKENLEKGLIKASSSPYSAPCFFVKKKDGSLRMCVDYRRLNAATKKNRYPLPLISELLRTLSQGKIFTTLDLRGAYNLLRIKEGHEEKSAFISKFGQFEFLVMPFGLANAPAQFQAFMNSLFTGMRNCVLVYLDDIVIFSTDLDTHKRQVKAVLEVLATNQLFLKPSKCHFYQESISYLGYIISGAGIAMDPAKVEAVTTWPQPKNLKELQSFLGFANFYRGLIARYSALTIPLTALLKKDVPFLWSEDQETAFLAVKEAFRSSSVLAHPNEDLPFILETDASDFAVGGVLSQLHEDGKLHPVAFFSRQMVPAERNYEVYDKELLAIIVCLKQWRHLLLGGKHRVSILSDHLNLQYFMTSKVLTRRQARWSLFLAEFDFVITYRKGSRNGKPDLLSRRTDYGVDSTQDNVGTVLAPNHFSVNSFSVHSPSLRAYSSNLELEFDIITDWPLIIADFMESETNQWLPDLPPFILEKCKKESNRFKFNNNGDFCRLASDSRTSLPYCPDGERIKVIQRYHDFLGHLKFGSIATIIKERFWWEYMDETIKEYIKRCPICQLNRSSAGIFVAPPTRPLPTCALPFERWGIDFVGPFPLSKNKNKYIITAIDYASRWVVAKAVATNDAKTVVAFLYQLLVDYGAPFELVSDLGAAFVDQGVQAFLKQHSILHARSTPYHPQSNGMVERMHSMLKSSIRALAGGRTDRWDDVLGQALFALRARNVRISRSRGSRSR